MENIQIKLIVLLCVVLFFPRPGSSQDSSTFELSYDVHRSYPYMSITKEKLNEAHTLSDLDKNYKSSWVKEYISVEVLTSYQGKTRKTVGKNNMLSFEQKDAMKTADVGTDISVKVRYVPDNKLKHNDPKEINFTFVVEPEREATYVGGSQQLKQYLKGNLMDKVSEVNFKRYQLAAVKFTIDEEGHVVNPHIFWTSEDEKTDKLLLDAVCNMPNWQPAEYANGLKVKQEFVLTAGDMESCVVNLLNIRQD